MSTPETLNKHTHPAQNFSHHSCWKQLTALVTQFHTKTICSIEERFKNLIFTGISRFCRARLPLQCFAKALGTEQSAWSLPATLLETLLLQVSQHQASKIPLLGGVGKNRVLKDIAHHVFIWLLSDLSLFAAFLAFLHNLGVNRLSKSLKLPYLFASRIKGFKWKSQTPQGLPNCSTYF